MICRMHPDSIPARQGGCPSSFQEVLRSKPPPVKQQPPPTERNFAIVYLAASNLSFSPKVERKAPPRSTSYPPLSRYNRNVPRIILPSLLLGCLLLSCSSAME